MSSPIKETLIATDKSPALTSQLQKLLSRAWLELLIHSPLSCGWTTTNVDIEDHSGQKMHVSQRYDPAIHGEIEFFVENGEQFDAGKLGLHSGIMLQHTHDEINHHNSIGPVEFDLVDET